MPTKAVVPFERGNRRSSFPPKPVPVSIDSGGHRDRVLARRDELVRSHLDLVQSIARAIHQTLPSGAFDLDDLIGAGNLTLLRAATSYRPDHREPGFAEPVPFSAWARLRVRGAIIEETRRRKGAEATMPRVEEMPAREESMEDLPAAEALIDAQRMSARLAEAISWLPAAQQAVLRAYYSPSEPSLTETARQLGIPAGRARAAHSQAVEALRQRFKRVA